MPSTEAKAVLIAAISHVTSKRVLARAQPVSLSRIELAVSRVDTALQRLPKLTEELENTLASERGDALRRASTVSEQLIVAKQIGKAESVIREVGGGGAKGGRGASGCASCIACKGDAASAWEHTLTVQEALLSEEESGTVGGTASGHGRGRGCSSSCRGERVPQI